MRFSSLADRGRGWGGVVGYRSEYVYSKYGSYGLLTSVPASLVRLLITGEQLRLRFPYV